MGEFAIGQPVARFEDPRLLRGGGRYVSDLNLPGAAQAFVLRSSYAHAQLVRVDADAARQAQGVLAVFTGDDWKQSSFLDLPIAGGRKRRDGTPMIQHAYPALATDKVRWVGDPVAFIVAETLAQAMDAAEMIEVEYEPLPANIDTAKANAPGTPAVWEDCPDNVFFTHFEGDKQAVEKAFGEAAHIVKHRFVINRVTAATMEPRGCVGVYDSAADHYTLTTTLQRAIGHRGDVAKVLGVPESKVRVIAGDIGGSFGMKSGFFGEAALVLWAARELGRPVRWVSTRTEAFLSDAQGRDNVTDAELALDKDGTFLALRVTTLANVGAYCQPGGEMGAFANIGTLAGVYKTPAIFVDSSGVFTNTNPMRPYRGNGRPEAAYVIERLIDIAAADLGFDPVSLRRRNMIPPDAMPFKTGLTFTYDSGEFEAVMDGALEMADVRGFEARRAASLAQGKLRGLGISCTIERAAAPSTEGAELRFDRSGSAMVIMGSVTQGQGHETVFKQIVCDRLGLKPDDVAYVQGDTDRVFFGEGTGGSRSATIGGSAIALATDRVIEKARAIAAHVLQVPDVDFADGVFTNRDTNRSLSIKDIAGLAYDPPKLPKGMEPGLVATAVYDNRTTNFPNGCHVCQLEIDPETGVVSFERYIVVDDVGTVLNPLLLKGQIHGGIAQGVGQILCEDLTFDPASGELLAASFMDYAMPRADGFCNFEVKSHPVPTKGNPLGVKGAGEAGCVGAMPAVANALVDALKIYGVKHVEMPATPPKLWRVIRDAKAAATSGIAAA